MSQNLPKIRSTYKTDQNKERWNKTKQNYDLRHGLLNIWTELLYLTFPHEADLLTLKMSHKLTQYL